MILFLLIYIIVILYGIKFGNFDDYLSKEKTTSIKGIFILMVFFSHFNGYVNYSNNYDLIWLKTISLFGQTMVTLFMFYSGYGIMESIKTKKEYVKKIPTKRILSTILKFDIAVVIYAIIKIILNESITVKQFLLSLLAIDSVGNSNWYIFAILVMYFCTYASFVVYKGENKKINLFINLILTFVYIVGARYLLGKQSWWYDTVLCYNLGMFYSFYKERINKMLDLKINYIFTIVLLSFVLIYLKIKSFNLITEMLLMLLFSLFIVVLTKKISINNKILLWFGNNLFEIYILQRIPMILLGRIDLLSSNIYLYFVLSLFFTIIITLVFKNMVQKINKFINI